MRRSADALLLGLAICPGAARAQEADDSVVYRVAAPSRLEVLTGKAGLLGRDGLTDRTALEQDPNLTLAERVALEHAVAFGDDYIRSFSARAVPEPGLLNLAAAGLAGLVMSRCRRARADRTA